jgi:hypothetical protein
MNALLNVTVFLLKNQKFQSRRWWILFINLYCRFHMKVRYTHTQPAVNLESSEVGLLWMVLLHAWVSNTFFFLFSFTYVVINCSLHLNKILNWGFLSSRMLHCIVGCMVPHHFDGTFCFYSHLAHENECSTFLRNFRNHVPIDGSITSEKARIRS